MHGFVLATCIPIESGKTDEVSRRLFDMETYMDWKSKENGEKKVAFFGDDLKAFEAMDDDDKKKLEEETTELLKHTKVLSLGEARAKSVQC